MSDQENKIVEKKEEEVVETTPLAELTAKVKQLEEESRRNLEEYNKDRKALIAQALDNGKVEVVEDHTQLAEQEGRLRRKLAAGGMSNLHTIKTSLELRDVGLKLHGVDSYQPHNSPDVGVGKRVAEGLRKIIEMSNGDDSAFLIAYNSYVKDNPAFLLGNK